MRSLLAACLLLAIAGCKGRTELVFGFATDLKAKGEIDHVGFASSFTRGEREAIEKTVLPLRDGKRFTGRAPGGPSRWNSERSAEWEPLTPTLVCEVRYDHFSGGRFRHGTKFLRWRPEKKPKSCTYDQLETKKRGKGLEALLAA